MPVPSSGDDEAADDEDGAADGDLLVPGGRVCGDGDDGEPTDDDDSQPSPDPTAAWGGIDLIHHVVPNDEGGVDEGGQLLATFYDHDVHPTPRSVLEPPCVPDSCSYSTFTLAELEAGTISAEGIDAGPLQLWTPELESSYDASAQSDGTIGYDEILSLGDELVLGQGYAIAVGSQEYLGFDTSLWMPTELSLFEPKVTDCPALDVDLVVAWSGGDRDSVEIVVRVIDQAGGSEGLLACRAANDGRAVIPASLLALLAADFPGLDPELIVQHRDARIINIDGVRQLPLHAGSRIVRRCR